MNLCYLVSTLITISEGRYLYDRVDYQPFQWFQPKYVNSNPQIHGHAGFHSNYYPNQYHTVNIPAGTFPQPAYNFGQPPVYFRNLDDLINYYKHLNRKIEYDINEMVKYPYRPYPFGANALDVQWNSYISRYFPQISTNDNESTNKPGGNSSEVETKTDDNQDVSTEKFSVTTERIEETTIIETTILPTTTLPTTTLPTTTLPTTTLPSTTLPTTTLRTTISPTTTTILISSTDDDENKIVFDEDDYVDYKPKMITERTETYDEGEDDYNYSEEEEEAKIEETATEKRRGLFGFF